MTWSQRSVSPFSWEAQNRYIPGLRDIAGREMYQPALERRRTYSDLLNQQKIDEARLGSMMTKEKLAQFPMSSSIERLKQEDEYRNLMSFAEPTNQPWYRDMNTPRFPSFGFKGFPTGIRNNTRYL